MTENNSRTECPDCGSETEFVEFASGGEDVVETSRETVGDGLLELRYCDNCHAGIENVLTLDSRTVVRSE